MLSDLGEVCFTKIYLSPAITLFGAELTSVLDFQGKKERKHILGLGSFSHKITLSIHSVETDRKERRNFSLIQMNVFPCNLTSRN